MGSRKPVKKPDLDFVAEYISYCQDSGEFRWIRRTNRRIAVGSIAGAVTVDGGYVKISIFGNHYYAHRLAFLFMTGEMPDGMVDHANGVRTDNRWSNLRLADNSQNSCNTSLRQDNSSGIKGLSFNSGSGKKWRAEIIKDGKCISRYFHDKESAEQFLKSTREALHKEFCNHG